MNRNLQSYTLKEHQLKAGGKLLDNAFAFAAKTIILSARSSGVVPLTLIQNTGNWTFQLELLTLKGGIYTRRFALGAYGAFTVNVEPFAAFRLYLVEGGLLDFDLFVEISDGQEASAQPPLLYSQILPAPGSYAVPWGAYELLPATSDAGFAWKIEGSGGAVAVAVPAVTGVKQDVAGTYIETTVLNFGAVWRIRP